MPRKLIALAAMLSLVLVACGGGDDNNKASSEATKGTAATVSTTTTVATATTAAAAGDKVAFCRVLDKINALFNTIPDPSGTSPETLAAFVSVSKQILALRDEALAAAPSDLDDDVTLFMSAVEKVANATNPTAAWINATYETPEQHAATTAMTEFCPSPAQG